MKRLLCDSTAVTYFGGLAFHHLGYFELLALAVTS